MIIYGTRMYGRKNQIRSHGRCMHCGRLGRQNSYDGRKWGHLYFIPLIPDGGRVRVLRECGSCRMGSHIPIERVPGLVDGLKKTLDAAVAALGAKESEMEVDGRRRSPAAVIVATLADLYCLAGEREVTRFLENLRQVRADEELVLAEAKAAEIAGDTREAAGKFGELTGRSRNPVILYQAACFLRDQGRTDEAIAVAERVEAMLVTDLDVKQLLIECYGEQKAWLKLARTYENCFLIEPELAKKDVILKAYKRACKKAERPPRR